MKRRFILATALALSVLAAVPSCKDDDDNNNTTTEQNNSNQKDSETSDNKEQESVKYTVTLSDGTTQQVDENTEYTFPEAGEDYSNVVYKVGDTEYKAGDKLAVTADISVTATYYCTVKIDDDTTEVEAGTEFTFPEYEVEFKDYIYTIGEEQYRDGAKIIVTKNIEATRSIADGYFVTMVEFPEFMTDRTGEVPVTVTDYDGTGGLANSLKSDEVKVSLSLIMKDGVTWIKNDAFRECTSLASITIPNSVTSIGKEVFSECTSLTSIDIPSSVTEIRDGAFEGCSCLTSIDIPSSVTSIGKEAFSECTSLTSIDIPSSVTLIRDGAFEGCTSLTSITIPSSVTSIGVYAFLECTSLTSVTIPSSVTSIKGSAFGDCTSLTSVTIPSSVTSIEGFAFSGCTRLTSVTIPSSLISISGGVFSKCTSLTSITIPSSVTLIGEYAFYKCSKLATATIYYKDEKPTIGYNAFPSTTTIEYIKDESK